MTARLLRNLSCFPAAVLALAASGLAQDVRDLSSPTGYRWYYGVDAATITAAIGDGYRPVDLEVESANPLRFTTAMVANSGAYSSGFWWYYGITAGQLSTFLSNNQGRLIDLEVYEDGGNTRFACVMVPNTGSEQKTWWYYYGQTGAQIASLLNTNNARPVDIDSYEINGTTAYDVVMISNTGDDWRDYAWYYNVPLATVQASVANGRRVYDLEYRPNGNFNAILVAEAQSPLWTWWYGLDAQGVSDRLGQYGSRPIDLETYFVNGERRFAMVTINNSNALTTDVGQLMRATTDGTVGCFLQRINGSELAALNGSRVFEPASTMKTLHHVHAFRQVALGNVSLATNVPVFTATNGSCPVDNNQVIEDLTVVLRDMMENSDNNRTQAIAAFFGVANINQTAAALGMASTDLNHRIGCAGDAIANPNEITLRNLGELHEDVANGYLGSWRDEFYEHMLNGLSWGGISTVIDQEAASIGLSAAAVTSFKALVELAQKGGSYTLIYNSTTHEHRAGFGWIRIPFLQGNQLAEREYAVGAFVNDATNGADASSAVSQAIGALLRPTLRSALQTWNVTAVAVPFGTGCNQPTPLVQTAQGLPRLGQNVTYRASSANPSSLAVLSIGFSDDFWGRTPLPASLAPLGAPQCFVYNEATGTEVTVANAAGDAAVAMGLPVHFSLLGVQYFTQYFSFGNSLKTSNGMRSVIGD
jgi:hypothetical protein